jgi:hypothetical protein
VAEEWFEPIAAEPELEAVAEPETEPAAEPEAPPVVEPEPVVGAEPELETDAEPATELEPADFPEPAETAIITAAERPPRWARRRRLRAVPAPPAEAAPPPPAAMPPPEHEPRVVSFPQRTYQPRRWNIWDLERSARAEAADHPELREEWSFLFVHLRQFANADGELPAEFDSLVRESFASLLERQPIR